MAPQDYHRAVLPSRRNSEEYVPFLAEATRPRCEGFPDGSGRAPRKEVGHLADGPDRVGTAVQHGSGAAVMATSI
jgi:hypothetical protein